jgi:hypothetical protein
MELRNDARERNRRVLRNDMTRLERTSETGLRMTSMTGCTAETLMATLDTTTADLASAPKPNGQVPDLKIFLFEDLSRLTIECLGSKLNIDPLFFREQIESHAWHNTRDMWATSPELTATMSDGNGSRFGMSDCVITSRMTHSKRPGKRLALST